MRGELPSGVNRMGGAVESPRPTPPPPAERPDPGEAASSPPTCDIRPPGRWRWPSFGEIWRYRELVLILALRDVKVRYKQTILGASWALLQPALLMIVFTIVFKRMANVPSSGAP